VRDRDVRDGEVRDRDRREHGGRSTAGRASHAPDAGIDAQPATSGSGPLLHRRYAVHVPNGHLDRDALMREIKRHVAELSPASLAAFRKSVGDEYEMRVGDEYDITILGPWNGRVRVVKVSRHAFTLATLQGHPEAGHITFSVHQPSATNASLPVTIESWARARDATVEVAYDTLKLGKRVQSEVWVTFLQRIAKMAGARRVPRVRITSERVSD
jgi:hypothetical protein